MTMPNNRRFGGVMHAAPSRRGFTLRVEMLVVIVVAVLFLGVMIPAIDASREAGRRNECARNQARIGAAILAWHESHDRFPTGVGFSDERMAVPPPMAFISGPSRSSPGSAMPTWRP